MNTPAPRSAITLRVLTALFAARVVGQALVAYLDVTWLIPIAFHWVLAAYLFTLGRLMQPDRNAWRAMVRVGSNSPV